MIDCLDFQHKAPLDQNIDFERCIEGLAVKRDWNHELAFHMQTTPLKATGQDRFIDTFKQARAKLAMDRNCFIDDDPRKLLDPVHQYPFAPSFSLRLCANPN
jgi:hypothetical protein